MGNQPPFHTKPTSSNPPRHFTQDHLCILSFHKPSRINRLDLTTPHQTYRRLRSGNTGLLTHPHSQANPGQHLTQPSHGPDNLPAFPPSFSLPSSHITFPFHTTVSGYTQSCTSWFHDREKRSRGGGGAGRGKKQRKGAGQGMCVIASFFPPRFARRGTKQDGRDLARKTCATRRGLPCSVWWFPRVG